MSNSNYILVKDKSGQLKYYKDGKFYDIEEIESLEVKKKPDNLPIMPKEPEVQEIEPAEFELKDKRSLQDNLIQDKVDQVIKKLKVKFSDKQIEKRFKNALSTYFRGVRSRKQLEYILSVPKNDGGLELPNDKIRIVVSVASSVQNPQQQVQKVDTSHQLAPPPPAQIKKEKPRKSVSQKQEVKQKKPQQQEKKQDILSKIGLEDGYSLEKSINDQKLTPQKAQEIKSEPTAPVQTQKQKKQFFKRQEKEKPIDMKPKIEDIKAERIVRGPVEELQYMDLQDFRRLDSDIQIAAEEIVEKVELLADQSYTKKVQGIKAWRTSPLFKLYLQMIMQGIKDGKPINEVIQIRQKKNQNTLTLTEFEKIAELNGKLVFE